VWLERALQYEADLGDQLSAILNARLSMEKIYIEPPDTGLVRAEKALSLAERGNLSVDNQLRIMSDLLHLLWRPDQLARRRDVVAQMEELANRVGKPHWLWAAHSFGFQLASEMGDLVDADRRLIEMVRLADFLKQPRLVQWTRLRQAVREAIRGDFDLSEELAISGWRAATAGSDADADLFLMGQLYTVHFHRDSLQASPPVNVGGPRARGATLAQLFAAKFAEIPYLPVLSGALAATYALAGDPQKTQHWLDEWNAKGARFVTISRKDQDQLAAVAALTVGATFVKDLETCEILLETLSPYASSFIDNGTSVHGSAAHYIAALQASLGRYDQSDEMFAYALEQNRSIESPPFEGLSLITWAESLAGRDPEKAQDNLLAATRIVAGNPDLRLVDHRIRALEARVMSS
jgi:tetratricopeptide (TPR) repeat protein